MLILSVAHYAGETLTSAIDQICITVMFAYGVIVVRNVYCQRNESLPCGECLRKFRFVR